MPEERKYAYHVPDDPTLLIVDTAENIHRLLDLSQRFNTSIRELTMQIMLALDEEDPLRNKLLQVLARMEEDSLTLQELILVHSACCDWSLRAGYLTDAAEGATEQKVFREKIAAMLTRIAS